MVSPSAVPICKTGALESCQEESGSNGAELSTMWMPALSCVTIALLRLADESQATSNGSANIKVVALVDIVGIGLTRGVGLQQRRYSRNVNRPRRPGNEHLQQQAHRRTGRYLRCGFCFGGIMSSAP